MSLTFGAVSTDRVDHGSDTTLDNADPFTLAAWVNITTATNNHGLYTKGSASIFRHSGNTGNVQLFRTRATTNTSYITSDTPLAAGGGWVFIAVTFDSAATPVVHIYHGTLAGALAESTYGTSTDGSGALTTDATGTLLWGNVSGINLPLLGAIFWVGVWRRALSLGELKDQQFNPHLTDSNMVLHCHYGNSATTQPDRSGHAVNNGTVTGATLSANAPLALPIQSGLWVPYAVTAAAGSTQPPRSMHQFRQRAA